MRERIPENNEKTPGVADQETKIEPLVSIVTPFYNTCDYLEECIESILRQSYQNWEYVLVDNHSTDGSSEIAARYVSRFPDKIRLIRTESFLSQVQNYNFALTCISPAGKYCKMVQADDWLFPECIAQMVELAEDHPSIGIVAAYQLEGSEIRLSGLPYANFQISGKEACRLYFLEDRYLFGSPTSSLIRSAAIREQNPFYEERYAPFEDGHICFDLLKKWDFGFVHQVLSFSRWDNGGILSRVSNFGLKSFLRLTMLVAHGRDFVSSDEYRRELKQAKRIYFVELTKSACALRQQPKEFWDFHKKGLAAINYTFNWKKFLRWLPRAIVEKSWEAFWRRWDRPSVRRGDSNAGAVK